MRQSKRSGRWIIFQDTESGECYTFDEKEILSVAQLDEIEYGEPACAINEHSTMVVFKNGSRTVMPGWRPGEVAALLTGAITEKKPLNG